MIGHVAVRDQRWKKFPLDRFDYQEIGAHRQLYYAISNKLKSLKKEAERAKEEKEASAKAEETRRFSEAVDRTEAKRSEEAARKAPRQEQQINSRSPDAASQGSKSKKRSGQQPQTLFEDASSKQTKITQAADGSLLIKEPEYLLRDAWEEYLASKRELKKARKRYENLRSMAKFVKTPPSTNEDK